MWILPIFLPLCATAATTVHGEGNNGKSLLRDYWKGWVERRTTCAGGKAMEIYAALFQLSCSATRIPMASLILRGLGRRSNVNELLVQTIALERRDLMTPRPAVYRYLAYDVVVDRSRNYDGVLARNLALDPGI